MLIINGKSKDKIDKTQNETIIEINLGKAVFNLFFTKGALENPIFKIKFHSL